MSLIDLNPTDDTASTLPRYDPQLLTTTVNTNELSGFGWANDITNSNDLYVASQPNFYRNSLDGNNIIRFSAVTNYVFIYQNVDSNWSLVQTISSVGNDRDNFGYSVSFSKTSGEYLAIGTFNRTTAAALSYVYVSNLGSPPTYTLQQTFTTGNYGTIANDTTNIGVKVQLNAAGDHLLIMGTTGIIEQFSRSGTTWTHETANTIPAIATYATASAALIGLDANADHTIIVRGCPLFPVGAAFAAQTGQVDVFRSSTTASETFVGSAGDRIGAAVAISSNGLFMAYSSIGLAVELDLRVIDSSGYVNIYNTVGQFTLQQQITGVSVVSTTGSFGSDLAMSAFGSDLVVGDAFNNNYSGSMFLFERADDIWSLSFELGQDALASEVIVLDSTNNQIVVTTAAPITSTITLNIGSYTGVALATELTTEMTSQTVDTYTVTYDNAGVGFSITISASTFSIEASGSINIILGLSVTHATSTAINHTSLVLPSFSYNGTELGRNVNVSESTAAFISGGYPGTEGPLPDLINGVGKGLISVFTSQVGIFQSAVIIDTTDTGALVVRKNNNDGDVFTVDTRTGDGIVISNGIFRSLGQLTAEATTDSTSCTTGGLVVSGGVGIGKSVNVCENITVTGTTTLTDTFTKSLPTPTQIDSIAVAANTNFVRFVIQGNYLYTISVVTGSPGVATLHIYDITNPSATVEISSVGYDLNGNTNGQFFTVQGNYVYNFTGGGSNGEFVIHDITDKNTPFLLNRSTTLTALRNLKGVEVVGQYGYGVQQGFSNADDFIVVDFSNPFEPVIVASITNTGFNQNSNTIKTLLVVGNYLYLVGNNGTSGFLHIIDVVDPRTPVLLSSTDLGLLAQVADGNNYPYDFDVEGRYIYMQSQPGVFPGTSVIKIRDISDPTTGGVLVGTYTSPNTINTASVAYFVKKFGQYVVMIQQNGVFEIIDVADPTLPFLVSTLITDIRIDTTGMQGHHLWVYSFNDDTIRVIDLHGSTLRTLDVGELKVGNVTVGQNLHVENLQTVTGDFFVGQKSMLTGQVTLQRSLDITTVDATNNDLDTRVRTSSGSFTSTATAVTNITGLLFTDVRSFRINLYCDMQDSSADIFSVYVLQGLNEVSPPTSTNAWALAVTRAGTVDPAITFAVALTTGQVTYTIPAPAGTFTSVNFYYEITQIL